MRTFEASEDSRARDRTVPAPGEATEQLLDAAFVTRQRARLKEMRDRILHHTRLQEDQRRWVDSTHYAPRDPEEVMVYELAKEVDTVLDRHLLNRLRHVRRALEKIEEGTYGICDATGEPIPRGRLEALPEALYTLEAQLTLGSGRDPMTKQPDDLRSRS
jgi:DnaK suppressor protein